MAVRSGGRVAIVGCVAGLGSKNAAEKGAGHANSRSWGLSRPGGLRPAPSAPPAAAPVPVTVSYPVEREVTDYADFTARTAAVDSVEVRARVWGYLDKVNFKEGDLVKKGDVLFEIDPRPYQALLNQAKAKVAPGRGAADVRRGGVPAARQPRAAAGPVSKSDLDKAAAARDVDLANIAADKAAGRVARAGPGVHQGHRAGQRPRQPLRRHRGQPGPGGRPGRRHPAHHDRVGGPDVRLLRRGRAHGAARPAADPRGQGRTRPTTAAIPVSLGLANEDGFPHQGTINFVDNQVNPKTGTLRVRGVFPNKDEVLVPGLFRPRPGARRPAPQGPARHRPRPRHRPGAEGPLRREREERGGRPPRPPRGSCTTACGDHRRPEAGRAGDRQRPAAGPAGRHRRAEAGGHADPCRGQGSEVRGGRRKAATAATPLTSASDTDF